MIERIQLIRNIGMFDSVDEGGKLPFTKLTLIYAENARGKTTLSAILRSLGRGDPLPIDERHRLSSKAQPHVVLHTGDGGAPVVFDSGAWTRHVPEIVVFDDTFIDENVYSGLSVEADHRQNLHELILGSKGIALNRALQALADRVEGHNQELRKRGEAIPASARGTMEADSFCQLAERPDVDAEIQSAERSLAAAREQDSIRNAVSFETIELPGFDADAIIAVLARNLASLDETAAARVQTHFGVIGSAGEAWVAEGVRRLSEYPSDNCPFCAQRLDGSTLIDHYRAYFSAEYDDLKKAIGGALAEVDRQHGGDMPAAFERAVRVRGEQRQFWSKFCDVPEISLDTAAVARARNAAREAVRAVLRIKQGAPLDKTIVPDAAAAAIAAFEGIRRSVAVLNDQLRQTNTAIEVVKEQAASGNPTALAADVARLKAVKARYAPEIVPLCDAYLKEKADKGTTETRRNAARTELNAYRTSIFPSFQTAINVYLGRFVASFRLDQVTSTNTRSGSSCTYSVLINVGTTDVAVPLRAGKGAIRLSLFGTR